MNPISAYSIGTTSLISEDLAYYLGLYGVLDHRITLWEFILGYTLGVFIGDILLYLLGASLKKINIPLLTPWIKKKSELHSKPHYFGLFEEYLVFTRFLPGTRLPTYLYCGMTNYSLTKFSFLLLIPTILYCSLGGVLVLFLKENYTIEGSILQRITLILIVGFASIFIFKFHLFLWKAKKNYGEIFRPLSIKVMRYRHLEFWNSWFLYLPFVPYFVSLLIRYRGFTKVLYANPALKMSGLIGEKKSEIDPIIQKYFPLNHLPTIPVNIQNRERLKLKIDQHQLTFPLIIKPDSGLRGLDVKEILSFDDFDEFQLRKKEFVIQQKSPYRKEIGLFYARSPKEERGHVFSITMKEFPRVIGDGKSTLFELIVKDQVLRNRFDWILDGYMSDPKGIPPLNQEVILGTRGSHSKGCVFRDGQDLIDHGVVENIAKTCDSIDGLFIGRLDIKYDTEQGLKEGKFHIIEINGAGGESTNIYDPHFGPLKIYGILKRQWDLVFKIGDDNYRTRKTNITLIQFLFEVLKYKKQS